MDQIEGKINSLDEQIKKLALSANSGGLPKPPMYDGTQPFEEYLRTFNLVATAHNWDAPRCCQVLPLYLTGVCRAIYASLATNEKNTWANLTKALAQKLAKQNTKEAARRGLASRKQKPGESLEEFALALSNLVAKAFPNSALPGTAEQSDAFRDEMGRDYFRNGVNAEIKEKLMYLPSPDSLNDAIQQAKEIFEIREALNSEARINAVTAETKQLLESVQSEICSVRKTLEETKKAGMNPPKQNFQGNSDQFGRQRSTQSCYSCGGTGHMRQQCPQRNAVCFNCQKQGHIAKICQSPRKRDTPRENNWNGRQGQTQQNWRNQRSGQQNQNANQRNHQTWRNQQNSNANREPLGQRGQVNAVASSSNPRSRSASPILLPFMTILSLWLLSATNAENFQICPNKLTKLVEVPTLANCSTTRSANMTNQTYAIYVPKPKPKSFPIFRCYTLISKVCTIHYSLYWDAEEPINTTGAPPSSTKCNELAWKTKLEQKSEKLWWTNFPLKQELGIWGEKCANTTNLFVEQGEAVVLGEKVVTSWKDIKLPYIHSGEREELSQDFTYIWNNSDPSFWHTHIEISPLNGTVINDGIFLIPKLEYALYRHPNQTRAGTKGLPRDIIRVQNGAFVRILEQRRSKRETAKREPERKPPRTKIPAQTRTTPSKIPLELKSTTVATTQSKTPLEEKPTSTISTQSTSSSTVSLSSSSTRKNSQRTTTVNVSTAALTRQNSRRTEPTTHSLASSSSTVRTSQSTTSLRSTSTTQKVATSSASTLASSTQKTPATLSSVKTSTPTQITKPPTQRMAAATTASSTSAKTKSESLKQTEATTSATKFSERDDEKIKMAKEILELKVQLDQLVRSLTTTKAPTKRSPKEEDLHLNSKLNYHAVHQDLKNLQLWSQQCQLRNNQIRTVISMATSDPISAVRLLFGRNDLIAKIDPTNSSRWFIGQCTTIFAERVFWNRKVNGICYNSLPILIDKKVLFIKPGTKDVVANASEIPCEEIEQQIPAGQANLSKNWEQPESPPESVIFSKERSQTEEEEKEDALANFQKRKEFSEKPDEVTASSVKEAVENLLTNVVDKSKAVGEKVINTAIEIKEEGKAKIKEVKDTYNFIESAWEIAKWLIPTIIGIAGIILLIIVFWKFRAVFQTIYLAIRFVVGILGSCCVLFGISSPPQRNLTAAAVRRQTPTAPNESLLDQEAYILDYIPQVNAVGGRRCHIKVKLNQNPIKALFDCGADLSYARYSAIRLMGIPINRNHSFPSASAANDTRIEFLGSFVATIQMGAFTKQHTFLVTRDTDCPADLLIGTELMEEANKLGHKIELDFHSREVTIGEEKCPMIAHIHQENRPLDIRILNTETIDPRSDNVVMAQVLEKLDEGEFITIPHYNHRYETISMGKCLVCPDKNGQFPIRLLNMGYSTVRVYANSRIGYLEKLESGTTIANVFEGDKSGTEFEIAEEMKWLDDLPKFSSNASEIPLAKQIDLSQSILSTEGKAKVKEMMEKYKDAFVLGDGKIGCFKGDTLHKIELIPGAKPTQSRPYRTPFALKPELEKQIREMLAQKIIRPSSSAFSAPVLLVKKADGHSWRFVVDYRALNRITAKQVYILPNIQDLIDSLVGKSIYSCFDLQSGFHQIPIKKEHAPRTAFITELGLFEYLRLPMGLCGAPNTFQLAMNELKHELTKAFMIYLDDIILGSSGEASHLLDLENLLKVLINRGLKLRPDKCKIGLPEVRYLGFILSNKGVAIDPRKIEAITKIQKPRSIHELRSLVGAMTYLRRFVPNFASHMKPFYDLTKNERSVSEWNEIHDKALVKMKQLLTSAPVLVPPRFGKEFRIETDASTDGLGACLMQKDEEGHPHPIAYFSRSLNKHEARYHPVELEALAIVASLHEFRPYIEGSGTTKIITDCSGMKALLSRRTSQGRMARFQIACQGFDFDIEHRPGRENHLADYLSRFPPDRKSKKEISAINLAQKQTFDEIREAQNGVRFVNEAKRALKAKVRDESYKLAPKFVDLTIWRDLLCKIIKGEKKVWIPHSLRSRLILEHHECPLIGAHLGTRRTVHRLTKNFTWKGMAEDVGKIVKSCEPCQRRKGLGKNATREPIIPISPASFPFERVHVDILGPLKPSQQHKYIFVMVDSFSKFLITVPLREQTATAVSSAVMKHLICRFGVPSVIVSDCGTQLTSGTFADLAKSMGFTHQTTTPYKQSSNGQVERQNKTVAEMLNTTTAGSNWSEALPLVTFAYNSNIHSRTNQTPFFIVHGFEPKLPVDQLLGKEGNTYTDLAIYVQENAKRLHECWSIVKENLEKAAETMQKDANERKRAEISPFYEQQLVLLKKEDNEFDKFRKFDKKFRGPYKILQILRPNLLVKSVENGNEFLVHMDKAKPFEGPANLPLRKDEKEESTTSNRQIYADRNIEDSDSEPEETQHPPPGNRWQATLLGGGMVSQSEADELEWEEMPFPLYEEDENSIQINAVSTENSSQFPGFTKWKIILNGEEEEALVAEDEDGSTIDERKVQPNWKIYTEEGKRFIKIIFLDDPDLTANYVRIDQRERLRFGTDCMCDISEHWKWTDDGEFTIFYGYQNNFDKKIFLTPRFEVETSEISRISSIQVEDEEEFEQLGDDFVEIDNWNWAENNEEKGCEKSENKSEMPPTQNFQMQRERPSPRPPMPIIPLRILQYLQILTIPESIVPGDSSDEDYDCMAERQTKFEDLDDAQRRPIENAWTYRGEAGLRRELELQMKDVDKFLRRRNKQGPEWRHFTENTFTGEWGQPELPGEANNTTSAAIRELLASAEAIRRPSTFSQSTTTIESSSPPTSSCPQSSRHQSANLQNKCFRLHPDEIARRKEEENWKKEREIQKAKAKENVERRRREEREKAKAAAEKDSQRRNEELRENKRKCEAALTENDKWVNKHKEILANTNKLEEEAEQRRRRKMAEENEDIQRLEERKKQRRDYKNMVQKDATNRMLLKLQASAIISQQERQILPPGGLGIPQPIIEEPEEAPQQQQLALIQHPQRQQHEMSELAFQFQQSLQRQQQKQQPIINHPRGGNQTIGGKPLCLAGGPEMRKMVQIELQHLFKNCPQHCQPTTIGHLSQLRNHGTPPNGQIILKNLWQILLVDWLLRNKQSPMHASIDIESAIDENITNSIEHWTKYWRVHNLSDASQVFKRKQLHTLLLAQSEKCVSIKTGIASAKGKRIRLIADPVQGQLSKAAENFVNQLLNSLGDCLSEMADRIH